MPMDPGSAVHHAASAARCTADPHLWVYDKASGQMLAEMELPANATGAPITDMAGAKQFIAFPVGGSGLVEELIAVSL